MALRTFGALALALSLSILAGCSPSPDRLSSPAKNFYFAIEDETKQKKYLGLKESERQSFLEDLGLWQKWLELSSEERDVVETKEVKVGFKEFAAHMAWGAPATIRDAQAGDRVVHYETFIRCTSGPRIGDYVRSNIDCDGTSSEVEIAVENGIVTEIKYLD